MQPVQSQLGVLRFPASTTDRDVCPAVKPHAVACFRDGRDVGNADSARPRAQRTLLGLVHGIERFPGTTVTADAGSPYETGSA